MLMAQLWVFGFWLLFGQCLSSNLYRDAAKFCLNNGLTYLTISSDNLERPEILRITKEAQALNLMTKVINHDDIPSNQRFYSDALMLLMRREDLDEFKGYFNLIQTIKIKRSVIVFNTKVTAEDMEYLKDQVRSINENVMFQFMFQENDLTMHYQVISIKNGGVVINPLNFNQFGHMIEKYDLNVKFTCRYYVFDIVHQIFCFILDFRACTSLEYLPHGCHK